MKPTKPDFTHDDPRHGDSRFWDRHLRARLGQDLRALFEDTLQEPLPERIDHALGQMEQGAGKDSRSPGSAS